MFDLDSPYFDVAKALEDSKLLEHPVYRELREQKQRKRRRNSEQPTDEELHKLWSEQKPARAAEREDEE